MLFFSFFTIYFSLNLFFPSSSFFSFSFYLFLLFPFSPLQFFYILNIFLFTYFSLSLLHLFTYLFFSLHHLLTPFCYYSSFKLHTGTMTAIVIEKGPLHLRHSVLGRSPSKATYIPSTPPSLPFYHHYT